MTDDLYERYKESLRVGHVAVLRGALEEALAAYRTAASIAPSRALPHTSLGGVLLRLGHLEEALVEYAAAVARAPHDEGALLGQAEALTLAGQRVDAAQALDHVSEIQEASGRLPEAADTLRRALELEDAPERARHQRGLLREIRLSEGDQAAEQLLARALRLRDEPSVGAGESARSGTLATLAGRVNAGSMASSKLGRVPAETDYTPAASDSTPILDATSTFGRFEAASESAAVEPEVLDVGIVETTLPSFGNEVAQRVEALEWPAADFARLRVGSERGAKPAGPAAEPALELAQKVGARSDPSSGTSEVDASKVPDLLGATVSASTGLTPASIVPILAAVGVMDGAFDSGAPLGPVGESEHQPTGDELLAAAETADLSGDSTTLRSLLLWTARAYAREGRFEAALDATHRLLQKAPGDVDAHLVLVELYVARDWNSLAADKLALLSRIAELDNDEETRQRLCAVASRAFPKDERLGALCA
jgi:tetratricopeptide (TPR) repeat protein